MQLRCSLLDGPAYFGWSACHDANGELPAPRRRVLPGPALPIASFSTIRPRRLAGCPPVSATCSSGAGLSQKYGARPPFTASDYRLPRSGKIILIENAIRLECLPPACGRVAHASKCAAPRGWRASLALALVTDPSSGWLLAPSVRLSQAYEPPCRPDASWFPLWSCSCSRSCAGGCSATSAAG